MSYLDVNLCHLFKKEANLRSGGPVSFFVFPFPCLLTFTLSPQRERLQDGRLEGGRFAVSVNIFFNEISLHARLHSWFFPLTLRLLRFFSAKKYALGESHLACSVSIFVLADESLVSLLSVVAMFDFG